MRNEVVLQPVWEFILNNCGWVCSHWLFAAWLGLATFIISCTYFTYKDLNRHLATKVQKDQWPTNDDLFWAAVPQVLIYVMLNAASSYYWNIHVELPSKAPSLITFILHFIICLVVGDFLIYAEHRVMHAVPYLRNNVHSVHHKYTAVFSWAGGVVHPFEDFVVIVCQCVTPLTLGVHPLTFWCFIVFWVLCLVDQHSGHDVWWSLFRLLPWTGHPLSPTGGGGAPHDVHHYNVRKNYGFVFVIWDRIFGTYVPAVEMHWDKETNTYKRKPILCENVQAAWNWKNVKEQ